MSTLPSRKSRNKDQTFRTRVLAIVKNIPAGQTLSYQAVAQRAGSPRAARAVGNIIKKNFDPAIPCHRVIYANGKPGHYNRGDQKKIKLLEQEFARKTETANTKNYENSSS